MLFSGYDRQNGISNRLPMPVDVLNGASHVQNVTSETLQLYFWNSGVLTIDAGQAAGTVVIGRFAFGGILDKLGCMLGNSKDTSVVFGTGTVLTTEVPCDYSIIEADDKATLEQIATALTANMSAGQYCIDYRNAVLYGKKATTGVSDTVSYKMFRSSTNADPGLMLEAVTPHNSTNFTNGTCRALYVGTAGNVAIVPPTGAAVTLVAVVGGTVLPISAIRVNSTGTTASNIVAIF